MALPPESKKRNQLSKPQAPMHLAVLLLLVLASGTDGFSRQGSSVAHRYRTRVGSTIPRLDPQQDDTTVVDPATYAHHATGDEPSRSSPSASGWHRARRSAILASHPEVRELIGAGCGCTWCAVICLGGLVMITA